MKCFLWLPKNIFDEAHFYLYINDYKENDYFKLLTRGNYDTINLKIHEKVFKGKPYKSHLIKKAYFSAAQAKDIAENWHEAFIKYHFPKYLLTQTTDYAKSENKFRFFISESNFLSSTVSAVEHYTGEINREVHSKILINEEVSHLGIALIVTDKYVGKMDSNILEIVPNSPVNSLMTFYKNIKPIADLILLLTSFAERRRINWYKCNGQIGTNYIENYNTRVKFYADERTTRLISEFAFEDFLKNTLQNIEFQNVRYITRILRSYLSGVDYSAEAKIILWNSILEKILKNHFGKKQDDLKENLLKQMHIFLSDLLPMQELINIRNEIAHGDDLKSDRLFRSYHEWETLIERVLLKELKWNDLASTDVHLNGIKPYGL